MPDTRRPRAKRPKRENTRPDIVDSASGKFVIQIHDCLTEDSKQQHGPEHLRRLFLELTRYLHNNFTINGVISDENYIALTQNLLPHVFIIINDSVLQDFVANGGFHIVTDQILQQTVDGRERANN